MRLLADENFPLPTIEALRSDGHDVALARAIAPSGTDVAILDSAEAEGRIILTLDKDFWQVARQRREPLTRGGVILFRLHPAVPVNLTPLVNRTLAADAEWTGHATVVTVDRVLMVKLSRQAKRP